MRAQKYLERGSEQFSKGQLEQAVDSLKRAYELDPQNSMIKSSLTLFLGENANRDFREGRLEEALKHAELLYSILPEDPDVLRLHNSILQALGKQTVNSPKETP